jgi:hypothetical protein
VRNARYRVTLERGFGAELAVDVQLAGWPGAGAGAAAGAGAGVESLAAPGSSSVSILLAVSLGALCALRTLGGYRNPSELPPLLPPRSK